MKRSSGIIMHISSLPEAYGIGTFGKEAYRFADFLCQAGQKYWQILPLGHTGYGDSPYQAFSAFAGNPYFIDLAFLVRDGLLDAEVLEATEFGEKETEIDYSTLFKVRYKVLKKAYEKSKKIVYKEMKEFETRNKMWLKDYACYMAIKEKMNHKSWQEWDEDIKTREKKALEKYEETLADEIGFWVFVQYIFFEQWHALKKYVNKLGIEIIGDLPIYVAVDSSDTWANPEVFKLDQYKKPVVVAGCPPDAFSETGQLWGNPIYDWDYLEKTNYQWWIERMRENLKLYDWIRIDHFRGFESYWEIPYGELTAVGGRWTKGPGYRLFETIEKELGKLPVIAEDLGFLTKEVYDFKKQTGYPGMKVIQFAFGGSNQSEYMPHTYDEKCIVYTGTHDNDTIKGWLETTGTQKEVAHAIDYLKLTKEEGYHWGVIRGAWSSVAIVAITMMQDLLAIGNEGRMNLPSTLGGNWTWRMKKNDLQEDLAKHVYNLTKLYGRCE